MPVRALNRAAFSACEPRTQTSDSDLRLRLGRSEHTLDTYQPEEQHGFRSKYRFEEHLLTANLFLDKATAHGIPVWLVSLDLSKAFDRVHWPTLWNALRAQGISDQMIWMLWPIRRHARQVGI